MIRAMGLAMAALAAPDAHAATVLVRVYDSETRLPVDAASVTLLDPETAAATDAAGEARFELPAFDTRRIRVEKEAYHPARARGRTGADLSVVEIGLRPRRVGALGDVLVSAERDARARGSPAQRITAQELRTFQGPVGDPVRVLHYLPGVVPVSDLSSSYCVRGGLINENLIVWDGVTIRSPFHMIYVLGGFNSIFNPSLVEDFTFYPGGFPARYGDRISSVVDFRSREAPHSPEPAEIGAALGLVEGSALARVALGERAGFHVAMRRSYFDAVAPRLIQGVDAVWPSFFDVQAKVETALPGGYSASAWILDYDDRFAVFGPLGGGVEGLSWDATGSAAGFRLDGPLSKRVRHAVTLGQNANSMSGRLFTASPVRVALKELYLQASEEIVAEFGPLRLRGGFQFHPHAATLTATVPSARTVQGDAPRTLFTYDPGMRFQWGAYVETDLAVAGGLHAQPSARFDRPAFGARAYASPRFTVSYEAGAFLARAGAGRFGQSPEILFAVPGYGVEGLEAERSDQAWAGIELSPGAWLVRADVYRRTMRRTMPYFNTSDTHFRSRVEGGHARGVELLVQRRVASDIFGWIGYAYGVAERQDPETGVHFPYDFDVRHQVTANLAWKSEDLDVSVRYRQATGRPYTPIVETWWNGQVGLYAAKYGEINSERIPAYSRLDVRLDYRWRWGPVEWGLYLDVINVMNHANIWDYAVNGKTGIVFPINQFPVLPTLGLTATW